ncbi:hypothetical protein CALCODRAFT_484391 [Calocera cornea HHB12733]|uniref:Uncharacterized protein n=1 Tax=Calocera cornea HHB12733 TaxID=1353952 RepID=A0A165F177_9BASI|nr:hypothetical protein CALCODRAFT_484391 [Calocera cornea HHB12733]
MLTTDDSEGSSTPRRPLPNPSQPVPAIQRDRRQGPRYSLDASGSPTDSETATLAPASFAQRLDAARSGSSDLPRQPRERIVDDARSEFDDPASFLALVAEIELYVATDASNARLLLREHTEGQEATYGLPSDEVDRLQRLSRRSEEALRILRRFAPDTDLLFAVDPRGMLLSNLELGSPLSLGSCDEPTPRSTEETLHRPPLLLVHRLRAMKP